jgi:hypothetical protein
MEFLFLSIFDLEAFVFDLLLSFSFLFHHFFCLERDRDDDFGMHRFLCWRRLLLTIVELPGPDNLHLGKRAVRVLRNAARCAKDFFCLEEIETTALVCIEFQAGGDFYSTWLSYHSVDSDSEHPLFWACELIRFSSRRSVIKLFPDFTLRL